MSLTITTEFCEVEGCYRTTTDKLCGEHQSYVSLNYLIEHKPVQSPVAVSKYSPTEKGLSCVKIFTEDDE
jgi:hypothetical protein